MPPKSKAPRSTNDGGEAKHTKSNLAPSISAASTSAASSRVYAPRSDISGEDSSSIEGDSADDSDSNPKFKFTGEELIKLASAKVLARAAKEEDSSSIEGDSADDSDSNPKFKFTGEELIKLASAKVLARATKGHTQAMSDSNFTDVIKLLRPDELTTVFQNLGLRNREIQNAKSSASTSDPESQAMHVFYAWRRMKGRDANQKAMLTALKKCRYRDPLDKIRKKWNIQGGKIRKRKSSVAMHSSSSFARRFSSSSASTDKPSSSYAASSVRPSSSTSAGYTQAMSDSNFTDVIKLLGPDELTTVFQNLGLRNREIQKAKSSASTSDPESQAMHVFYAWRKMKGCDANQKAVLKALKKSRYREPFDKLRKKWNIKGEKKRKRKSPAAIQSISSFARRFSSSSASTDKPSSSSAASSARPFSSSSAGKVNDRDIRDVTRELSRIELQKLYMKLGLQHRTVEKVEMNANDTGDVHFKAMAVLYFWRQNAARAATRKVVLDALLQCNLMYARENLTEKWGIHRASEAIASSSGKKRKSNSTAAKQSSSSSARRSSSSPASTARPPSSSSAYTNKPSSSSSASTNKPSSSSSASTARPFSSSSAGFPAMLLLWRAIVRQVTDILRRHMYPTYVARSVLTSDDTNKIARIEQNEGRLQAVDHLIGQLLMLKDLRWTNSFPSALKEHHPEVFDAVTKAKEQLYNKYMFSRCRYTVCDTITSDGGVLELKEFGVRLEIPAGAIQKKEDIAVSVVSSKDNHPPLGDKFIVAPIVQLEPCGLQFLKPVALTLRHAGVYLKWKNLQLWKRSRNNDWGVVFDGKDGSTVSNIRLTGKTVSVRQTSFCLICWLGFCLLDVQILPFIDKDLIPNTVTLTIFAVTDHDAKIIVEDKKSKGKEDLAYPTKRYLLKSCKNLHVGVTDVKDWDDEESWRITKRQNDTDEAPEKKQINRKELQLGNSYSSCEFLFTKLSHDVNSIWCDLEIGQKNNTTLQFRMKQSRMQNVSVHTLPEVDIKFPEGDIKLITHEAGLGKADLDNLFGELKISTEDQDLGRRNADTLDFKLQAKHILYIWRKQKGKAATRNAVVEALHKCELVAAKELIQNKWGLAHT